MKKRLKEMEEEASALRDMQAKVEKEMGGSQGSRTFTCSHSLTGMH
jgi:polyadenylate-binding protein 2